MNNNKKKELAQFYRQCLFDDVLPFWLKHSPDPQFGGYFNCLDQDGSVYNTDKGMWIQCRATWLLSRLQSSFATGSDWLEKAKDGRDFIMKHGFDSDGRMFFLVTRDGRPLRKRRYLFTEAFGTIALSEYARASGDDEAWQRARETFSLMIDLNRTPGALEPQVFAGTRETKSLATPMILLATAQELRRLQREQKYEDVIDEAISEICQHFLKPDDQALLETVGKNGNKLDSPEGRCVNPGHAIETAWFLLQEGQHRSDQGLVRTALEILKWSLEWGWDKEYGGIFYFVDIENKPPEQLEWDMKLWWPHTEAIYALLLAHHITGEKFYLEWYQRVHDWAFDRFPDSEYGEWFGYLHRDGSLSLRLKGSLWKGPFHLPRSLMLAVQLLSAPD